MFYFSQKGAGLILSDDLASNRPQSELVR
jgi:hypothetical protein